MASLVLVAAPAGLVAAQESGAAQAFDATTLLYGVISTLVYGVVGIALAMVGYQVFAWMLPFDVKKELEEDQNISVGVLLAALMLGICIVVAATIHS